MKNKRSYSSNQNFQQPNQKTDTFEIVTKKNTFYNYESKALKKPKLFQVLPRQKRYKHSTRNTNQL